MIARRVCHALTARFDQAMPINQIIPRAMDLAGRARFGT
jgi:hypothetical protein